ncbi:MAG TPA: AraC family transcriptional regulator [Opitutus sp.]|nr:AraC family transcriptional regulator [Opitutus sp.]
MRAIYEAIHIPEKASFRCMHSLGRAFIGRWHFHPEIELMFVERGSSGMRFVGDHSESFREGDLVLVGPDLPHFWLNDNPHGPLGAARAYVVQFPEDFLGPAFWLTPEFRPIGALLRRSQRGIRFAGPAVRKVAATLRMLSRATGAARVLLLLQILDVLARSREQVVLSSAAYLPELNRADAARINAVCRYVGENLSGEIWRDKAAALARLQPETFSRFFRKKMGCTFSAYVSQLRISRAIHLMTEENMNISEACFASGFNNLSNFNAQFRALKGMNPRGYLGRFAAGLQQPSRGVGTSGSRSAVNGAAFRNRSLGSGFFA